MQNDEVKLFFYHGIACNNGDGTWSCPYCGFVSSSPSDILDVEEGCSVGKPPCSACGGGRECAPDCPGVMQALSSDTVYIAGGGGCELEALDRDTHSAW